MSVSGFEVAAAARLLSPIIKDLYAGAKGAAEKGFKKWKAANFATKLSKKIGSADKVKTIWSPDKDISLMSIYYPSKISLDGKLSEVKTIDDFKSDHVVIEGIVGQGKSIFLRYLCLQELTGNGTGRIPLFLELRTVLPGKNLKDYLFIALEKLDLAVDDETFEYLMESGKIALLLDGFDELDENLVTQAISNVEDLAEQYPDLKIVITSRPENEIQKSRLFTVVKIAKLIHQDFDPFLKKLSISTVRRAEIISAINKSPREVSGLVNTPLMLTLLVLVYESEKEIPSELPDFFEKLFHTVFTKHDKLKAGFNRQHHCGLSERKLQEIFEAFCFMVLQNGFPRSLTADQFHEAFTQALSYTSGCDCEQEDFRKDITKVACLMLEEGFDLTTFLHKSICEYYGAGFIKRSSSEVAELFYGAAKTNYRQWDEVLYFLQKIDPYRCARFFLIPVVENILEKLGSNNTRRTDDEAVSAALKQFSDARVVYYPEMRDKDSDEVSNLYDAAEWGPFTGYGEFANYHQHFRDRVVFDGIEQAVPQQISKNAAEESSAFIRSSDGIKFELRFMDVPKYYPVTELIEKIKTFEERLRQELEGLKKMVKQEEMKRLIFAKK